MIPVLRKVFNRTVAPYLAILTLTLIAAIVFHYAEHGQTRTFDKRVQEDYKCIGNYTSFSVSIFYVISLCSTIGFGTLYPCTTATRIISVPVLLIGITLFLYIVADIGEKTEKWFRKLYNKYRKHHKRWTTKRQLRRLTLNYPHGVEMDDTHDHATVITELESGTKVHNGSALPLDKSFTDIPFIDGVEIISIEGSSTTIFDEPEENLPVTIGLSLTVLCIFTSTIYYACAEEYSYGEAVYFSFLAFFAGDFIAYNFAAAVPMFMFIFTGFIMMSMTVNTILANLRNLVNRVKSEARRSIEAASIGSNGELNTVAAKQMVEQLIAEHGAAWIISYIPASELESMRAYCTEKMQQIRQVRQMENEVHDMKETIQGLQKKITRENLENLSQNLRKLTLAIPLSLVETGMVTDRPNCGSSTSSQTPNNPCNQTKTTENGSQTVPQQQKSSGMLAVFQPKINKSSTTQTNTAKLTSSETQTFICDYYGSDSPRLSIDTSGRSRSGSCVEIQIEGASPTTYSDYQLNPDPDPDPDLLALSKSRSFDTCRMLGHKHTLCRSMNDLSRSCSPEPLLTNSETQTELNPGTISKRTVGTQFPGKFRHGPRRSSYILYR